MRRGPASPLAMVPPSVAACAEMRRLECEHLLVLRECGFHLGVNGVPLQAVITSSVGS